MPDPLRRLAGRAFAAVLFDLDGTLIDSTAAVGRSWARWAEESGYAEPLHVVHGVPARAMLARILPADQVDAAFRHIEGLEIAETGGVTVLPGALAALAAIPGDRMAIVTSGTVRLAYARIEHTALPVPGVVITADDVRNGKPDPQPYLLAAQRLGVDPRDCLVVEDAHAGLTAGRAAGCATLALRTTHPDEPLDADAVIDTLADVRFVPAPAPSGWITLTA